MFVVVLHIVGVVVVVNGVVALLMILIQVLFVLSLIAPLLDSDSG